MLATVAAIAISTLMGSLGTQAPGPITKAVERDAPRLAAAAPAPQKAARRERGKADWSRLKRLRPGKEIRVKTVTTDRRATFLKADDQQLWIGTVGIPGSEEVLDAADVLKVSRRERRGSTWGAVGGALAGAAVGFYSALALA